MNTISSGCAPAAAGTSFGTPKSDLRKLARQIADARDWHTVRDGVEAKPCVCPDGQETFVVIRALERPEKERAMHARFGAGLKTA